MAFNEVNVLASFVEFLPKLLLFGAKDLPLYDRCAPEVGFDFVTSQTASVEADNVSELVDLILRKYAITVTVAF